MSSRLVRSVRLASWTAALAAMTACATSTDEDASGATLTLAITDAASDELASFIVDVTSVELRRPGGAVVGVLPQPVSVDFVTLEEISQVLNVVNVPPGLYAEACITLDFTDASALLIGETTPATLLDSVGQPLTGTVKFPIATGNALRAIGGRNRLLELDFDLDQSLQVDAGSNAVSVEPSIVLRVDRTDPKELFAGGEVLSVDTAASTLEVELQTLSGTPLATVSVVVEDTTLYQIDGVAVVGSAGLDALAGLPTRSWVQCYGAIRPLEARICALYVEAGAGTYNGGTDIVEGHIVSRTGGAGADAILTVLGHSNNANHTSFLFNTSFTLQTSFTNTKVPQRGGLQSFDTDDLNIGQRVRAFGSLSGFTLDVSGTQGVVRVQPSRVLGFANDSVQGTTLDLDLVRVDLRSEGAFTWDDAGTSPPDPDALQLETSGLATNLGIQAGTAVEARGFFTAVDEDTQDFIATSVTNRDLAPSLVVIHDRTGGFTVTPTIEPTQIVFDIAGSPALGEFAVIDRGFVGSAPIPNTPAPSVTPAGAFGIHMIHDRTTGSVALHLVFADFTQALDALLAQGAMLHHFGAAGPYDTASNTLSTGLTYVVVQ